MSTFNPTYSHKGLHERPLWHTALLILSILLMLLAVVALGFVEYVFLPLGLCKSCLWLLDYALKSFWFVSLVGVILHLYF